MERALRRLPEFKGFISRYDSGMDAVVFNSIYNNFTKAYPLHDVINFERMGMRDFLEKDLNEACDKYFN